MHTGTQYFLLQLSVCDIVSNVCAAIELMYIYQQRWTFPPDSCPLYLGVESISSIATVYFVIALNLHALSTYNLARQTIRREDRQTWEQQQERLLARHENDLLVEASECAEDVDLKNEICADAERKADVDTENQYAPILADSPPPSTPESDTIGQNDGYETPIDKLRNVRAVLEHTYQEPCYAPRCLTIDYSQRKTSVSVIWPVLFVWFVAASASTPLFSFGSVLPSRRSPNVCGVVNFDPHNNRLLQAMVLAVRVVMPTLCLMLSGVAVLWTQRQCRRKIRPCGLDENVADVLRVAAVLTLVFLLASEQHVVGSLMFELWSQRPLMVAKYPWLDVRMGAMALCMLHWSAAIGRPFVYVACDAGGMRTEVRRTLGWKMKAKIADGGERNVGGNATRML